MYLWGFHIILELPLVLIILLCSCAKYVVEFMKLYWLKLYNHLCWWSCTSNWVSHCWILHYYNILYQWSLMRIPLTLVYIYVGSVGVCTQYYILWAQMRNLTLVYIYVWDQEKCVHNIIVVIAIYSCAHYKIWHSLRDFKL